jgi:hypothetical protein
MSSAAATMPEPRATIGEETLLAHTESPRRRALFAGAVGLLIWFVLALFGRPAFTAYVASYMFFEGIAVGSLGFLMLHHLVGGAWGFAIRRPLEAATMTLPILALLFLPVVLGMRSLYEWANPEDVHSHAAIGLKAGYLNIPFFLVRAAVYHAIWVGLALLMRRNSMEQDTNSDPAPTRRNQQISAPGLVIIFITVTFAAIDWTMSLEPEWYSTIYSVMILIGWALSALSVAVIAASMLSHVRPLAGLTGPEAFNDLGNLLLAFTMLWAYMGFSQYLLIWSGNLTEEIPWYLSRSYGGWRFVAMALVVFHFFVPFFCLLVRENKRATTRLWRIAAAILVMHLLNDAWLVIPAFATGQGLALLAVVPSVGAVGGLWLWSYLGNLTSRSLAPRHDPLLAQVFEHHGGGH